MMTIEEIKRDLLDFVKSYYEYSDVMYLDVNNEEVELRFHVLEEDRNEMKRFYKNNRHIFQDETDETEEDLQTLDNVSIRVDADGVYFGKSAYDLLATNVVAFYLLEKYLNPIVEEVPSRLKEYRAHQIIQ